MESNEDDAPLDDVPGAILIHCASFEVLEPSLSAGGLQFDDAWQQMANADAVCVHALAEVQRAQSLFSNAKDALIEASIGLSMAQGHYAQALHGSYVDAPALRSSREGSTCAQKFSERAMHCLL